MLLKIIVKEDKGVNYMTKDQIKMYVDLKEELEKSANRVADYFVKINSSYEFIDSWQLYSHEVEGKGVETWNYGGYEEHFVSFDVKWLYATDEELQNYVNSVLEKRKQRLTDETRKKNEEEKEKKYQKYLELKKEFEGEN